MFKSVKSFLKMNTYQVIVLVPCNLFVCMFVRGCVSVCVNSSVNISPKKQALPHYILQSKAFPFKQELSQNITVPCHRTPNLFQSCLSFLVSLHVLWYTIVNLHKPLHQIRSLLYMMLQTTIHITIVTILISRCTFQLGSHFLAMSNIHWGISSIINQSDICPSVQ